MFQMDFLKNESPEELFWQALVFPSVPPGPGLSVGGAIPCPSVLQMFPILAAEFGPATVTDRGGTVKFSHNAARRCCLHCFPSTSHMPTVQKWFFWELSAMHTCLYSPQDSLRLPLTSASRKVKEKTLLCSSPFHYR